MKGFAVGVVRKKKQKKTTLWCGRTFSTFTGGVGVGGGGGRRSENKKLLRVTSGKIAISKEHCHAMDKDTKQVLSWSNESRQCQHFTDRVPSKFEYDVIARIIQKGNEMDKNAAKMDFFNSKSGTKFIIFVSEPILISFNYRHKYTEYYMELCK